MVLLIKLSQIVYQSGLSFLFVPFLLIIEKHTNKFGISLIYSYLRSKISNLLGKHELL